MDREINVVVEKLSRLRELRAVVSTNNTSCLRAWGLCEYSRTSRRMPTPFLSIGVWNFFFFFFEPSTTSPSPGESSEIECKQR